MSWNPNLQLVGRDLSGAQPKRKHISRGEKKRHLIGWVQLTTAKADMCPPTLNFLVHLFAFINGRVANCFFFFLASQIYLKFVQSPLRFPPREWPDDVLSDYICTVVPSEYIYFSPIGGFCFFFWTNSTPKIFFFFFFFEIIKSNKFKTYVSNLNTFTYKY